MRGYNNIAGRVMIKRLLDHSNLTFWYLLFLTTLVDSQSRKNWLFYNHCLGIYQHGKTCVFCQRNRDVDGNKLPIDFAMALGAKLRLGIEFMARSKYPAQGAATSTTRPASVNCDTRPETKRHPTQQLTGRGGAKKWATGECQQRQGNARPAGKGTN